MTEAWALCDRDALANVFGAASTELLGALPSRPHEVEGVLEPKRVLESAYEAVVGARGARRNRLASLLGLLGQVTELEALAALPAFHRLQDDLTRALRRMRLISP